MPFATRDLSVLAYANGFTLWHYKLSNDGTGAPVRVSDLAEANYFLDVCDMMAAGDMILVSIGNRDRGAHGTLLVVSESRGDLVTTAPLTQ